MAWRDCTSVIKQNIEEGAQRVGSLIQLLQLVSRWGAVLLELRQLETGAEGPPGPGSAAGSERVGLERSCSALTVTQLLLLYIEMVSIGEHSRSEDDSTFQILFIGRWFPSEPHLPWIFAAFCVLP